MLLGTTYCSTSQRRERWRRNDHDYIFFIYGQLDLVTFWRSARFTHPTKLPRALLCMLLRRTERSARGNVKKIKQSRNCFFFWHYTVIREIIIRSHTFSRTSFYFPPFSFSRFWDQLYGPFVGLITVTELHLWCGVCCFPGWCCWSQWQASQVAGSGDPLRSHWGKDGRHTSVLRLTENDPERPAAPLVWEPSWHEGSLRPFGAIQSIDRPYLYTINWGTVSVTVWECHEKNGISKWEPLQQLHTRISMIKTSRASVAQLVRARDCQSLGRQFDSV